MPQKGTVKWRPKKWLAEYDRIVALAVLNKTNEEIAEQTGYTKEHVSTILNLPEGKLFYEKLKNAVKKKIEDNIPALLEDTAKKAAARINDIVNDDTLRERAPFQMASLSMDVLKGIGHLKSGVQSSPFAIVNNGQMVVTTQQHSDILEGISKIEEVKRIHSLPATPARIKDGTNG